MRSQVSLLLGLLGLAANTCADPTWPSPVDEIEEIMYQLTSFRSRKFADTISPCSSEASGPGRVNAAEWLRTGFHDMANARPFFGTGGIDASLQYEVNNGENTGPGFNTTLRFYADYLSRRSSMSDLIALGVVLSVRSCGGPTIPLRIGRIDASESGGPGVPQPGNTIQTFRQQFTRMGFNEAEMIQMTACGHTLGGVHSSEFPRLVPPGSAPNDQATLDATVSTFDNAVVTEYLANTTRNPLIVSPSRELGQDSDFKVFNADGNVTMRALADPAAFRTTCASILQRMVEVVPSGVALSTPVLPYAAKPVAMQLFVQSGGTFLLWTGYIRIRTTQLPRATIAGMTIRYKNRNGGDTCGSGACAFAPPLQGIGSGFDEEFAFFPINQQIPAASGISSFTVTLNLVGGGSILFDNNGATYPMDDSILFQQPQSCLLQGSGSLTVVAAVRNDRATLPASSFVSYKAPQSNSPIPNLQSMTIPLTRGACAGYYTFFTGSATVPGGRSGESTIDVTSGEGATAKSVLYRAANDIGGSCQAFTFPPTCQTVTPPTSSSSSSSVASSTSTTTTTSTSSSASPTGTLSHRPTIGAYNLVGCWTDDVVNRALTGAYFASPGAMTLESCMASCAGYDYFGTEYGHECFCGNTLGLNSAPLADCNMPCEGNPTQFCGAGNRLELYSRVTPPSSSSSSSVAASTSSTSTTSTSTTSSTTSPSASPTVQHVPSAGKFTLVGCQTDDVVNRALSASILFAADMTIEKCAAFCADYEYFGTEYSQECYCGNSLAGGSTGAPLADCAMTCAGNPLQYCGGPNRLDLYKAGGVTSSSASSSTTRSTTSSTTSSTSTSSTPAPTTPQHVPTASPYSLVGCWTEATGIRTLSASQLFAADMTVQKCAAFCSGYKYFGTEYSQECYCGNSLASGSAPAPFSECSMTCAGNPLQYCGGPNRLDLYEVQTSPPTGGASQPQTAPGGFSYEGCLTEPTSGVRALAAARLDAADMTIEKCAAFCASYQYFGTEYSAECYCANSLTPGSVAAVQSDCNMVCSGSASQYCGGPNRLSAYKKCEYCALPSRSVLYDSSLGYEVALVASVFMVVVWIVLHCCS